MPCRIPRALAASLLLPLSTAFAELPAPLSAVLLPEHTSAPSAPGETAEFDDLAREYAARVERKDAAIATFDTLLGGIAFGPDEVAVQWTHIPERAPAFVRIGRRQSSESRELIVAWLTESTAMKLEQGYKEVAREEFDTAYGQGSFALFRNGDRYFSTYLQYERTRNGNDTPYLAHTYHVEFGLWSRAGSFRRQQALLKLGN